MKMMPALSGINTLSKEKSVFLCYTRKLWSTDKMMPALSGINTLRKEKTLFSLLSVLIPDKAGIILSVDHDFLV
jgi:hypothetical protein